MEYKHFEDAFVELGLFNQTPDKVKNKLQEADKDLDRRESRLSADEKRIYDALDRYVDHSPSRPPFGPLKPSSLPSSSSSSSSSGTDLAEDYYEAAGTVKILRERLLNKQIQQLQDLSLRHNDIEIRKSPQPPEKDFRKGHLSTSVLYTRSF